MPDHTDERIRALIVELAEHAPIPPSLQELDDRGTTVGQPRRPRVLKAGAIAVASVALITAVLLTRPEDRSNRVRAGSPSTTTTAPVNRPLRLTPTVLPAGFVEKPGASDGLTVSYSTGSGTGTALVAVAFGRTGTTLPGALPPAMVQSSTYTRGAASPSGFGALGLFVWGPTGETAAHPTGVQRRIGDRLVTISRPQVPGAGSSTPVVTSASWQETGYDVSVLAFAVTDAELEAFIAGLHAAGPQVGDIVGQLEKQPDGSCKGSFGVGGSDEPGEGGTIVAAPDAECTVRIKEITSDPLAGTHGPGG